ncbi:hypothetical protein [Methylibium petroleiphilum]|nr:hypothetical protein [Methylibium petroleiphilum]
MTKAVDRGAMLNHVYGLAGLIPALIGLVFLVKNDASWYEYALLGSGWFAAIIYGLMLVKAFHVARADGELIGRLTVELEGLKREMSSRNATLDYLASLQMGRVATPRAMTVQPHEDGEAM